VCTLLTEESLTRLSSNNESTMDAQDSPCLQYCIHHDLATEGAYEDRLAALQ